MFFVIFFGCVFVELFDFFCYEEFFDFIKNVFMVEFIVFFFVFFC